MLHTDLAASPDDRVLPAFGGRSVLNLVTSLTARLGLPPASLPFSAPLPLEGVERVVLFVVDGMGHFLLNAHLERGEMPWLAEQIQSGNVGYQSATSTFPSSTMIALTTLHTGLPPAQHGWLGTSIYLNGSVVDLLRQTDVLAATNLADPGQLIRASSVYRRLQDMGVPSAYVSPAAYEGQFLDRFYFDGGAAFRYGPLAPLPTQVARASASARYVLVYWPDYDTENHLHGPHSQASAQAAGAVDALVRQTLAALPADGRTLLVITADHGQRATPAAQVVPLTGAPPAGENRFRYFAHEPQGLPAGVEVWSSQDLWDAGLYGGPPAHPDVLTRTGRYAAIVHGGAQLTYDYGAGPLVLNGNHGGLSAVEMVVPVLSIRR